MDGSNKDRNISRLTEAIPPLLSYIRQEAPLIHCITNPISINDCANILLAIGARPIMAEHPKEVAEITAIAKALALNLGNITDARMESMQIASHAAHRLHIPAVIDLVGIACSSLRLDYARKLISQYPPAIIKGNISELRTLLGLRSSSFTVEYQKGVFTVEVLGYGHGVGLSQYGAQYLAQHGKDYRTILAHYYPGTQLCAVG